MPKKPSSPAPGSDMAVQLRPVVRETMQLTPKRRFTPPALLALLRRTGHAAATLADIEEALTWNLKRGWMFYDHNAETELKEYYLTEEGKQA